MTGLDKRCKNCAGDKRGKHGECFYCGSGSVQTRDICDPGYNPYADIARGMQNRFNQGPYNQGLYNQNMMMQQHQMKPRAYNDLYGLRNMVRALEGIKPGDPLRCNAVPLEG